MTSAQPERIEEGTGSLERVASLDDVPEGEVRVVMCGDRELALSNVDGTLHAIDNVCTHDGGPLGEGRLRGNRVICPRHGAAFDARTGKVLTLPAVRSVRSYPVSVDGDEVLVDIEAGKLP
jgi:3-phenylpropionate/trans-cinnamate dioxygenase ferredoxin subunit